MPQPGRPRRRNKYAQPQQSHQEHHGPRNPVKEEPTSSLHDESDLISYRTDALVRLVSNQEYLEALVKYVHVDKIKPPKSFPDASNKTQASELAADDVFVGNLELMKSVQSMLDKDISSLSTSDDGVISEEYEAQKQATNELARLAQETTNEADFQNFKTKSEEIFNTYSKKFNRQLIRVQTINKFQNPQLAQDIAVEEAPKDYNPRSVNNLINLNANDRGNSIDVNMPEGMDIDNFLQQQQHQPPQQPQMHPNHAATSHMVEARHSAVNSPALAQNPAPHPSSIMGHGATNEHSVSPNMNGSPFQPNMDLDNAKPSDMGVGLDSLGSNNLVNDMGDDMGDLINFQGDEEEIMHGNFDEDFLSQIDPGME